LRASTLRSVPLSQQATFINDWSRQAFPFICRYLKWVPVFSNNRKEKVMNMQRKACMIASGLALCGMAQAQTTVDMHLVDEKGSGKGIGQVVISESPHGVVFTPKMSGLPAGLHGFHVHENGSCEPKEKDGKMVPALAAGGHYDPAGIKRHGLPWGDGHLGDLPALAVDASGNATNPVLAPRLKMADLQGRSLMVHAGGDNHADQPAPLGGGGARLACGVIK
jgi:Cu-Zn family superoxide dismutase